MSVWRQEPRITRLIIMNTLATKILKIKQFLSDKNRWDQQHDESECCYNLMNELAALWCCAQGEDKRYYPAAYKCVAQAALDLFEKEIKSHKIYLHGILASPDPESPYPADDEDVKIVWALEKVITHDELMITLDLSIRYANLIAFS